MQDTGTALYEALRVQRSFEEQSAQAAYLRSQTNMRTSQEKSEAGDYHGYWYWRQAAMTEQIEGDRHAYAESILAGLLHPPAVATYRPHDDGHMHSDAGGADGRDDHSS
jgi:hypothetical protein